MSAPTGRPSVSLTLRVAGALALLLPPLWVHLRLTRDSARAFALVQRCARRVLRLAGCRVRVIDIAHMPEAGPVMLVCNHTSLADAAVLLAALPFDFRFVANHAHARYPLLGAAIRSASASIVDRGSWRSRADAGQAMVDALAAGQSLLVFPEGTTSVAGMLPFRSGAFRAAARTSAPVVPVVLRGSRDLMPSGTIWLRDAPLEITVLPAMAASDPTREGVGDLRDRAAHAIRARLAEGA